MRKKINRNVMIKFVFAIVIFTIAYTVVLAENNNAIPRAIDQHIVSRSEWGATPPRHLPTKLENLPPKYVIIGHTGSAVCLTKESCLKHVRNIQVIHQKQLGWKDIAYNFLVGGDGNVYEGRSWDVEGAHTIGYNQRSLGIAFIGDFRYNMPTQQQLAAGRRLITIGLEQAKIDERYKLLAQKQLGFTQSPGDKLYNFIKTWDHWTEKPSTD